MTISLRSATAFCAALAIAGVAPAQADPDTGSSAVVTQAALPTIKVPNLLDSEGEPVLAGDQEQALPGSEVILPSNDDEGTAEVGARPTGDLDSMVAQLRASEAGSRELECLATGIYFESKSEPLAGQLAVGHVIANRANSNGRFPGTYCGVLMQRGQFSFIRNRSLPSVPRSSKQWKTAVAMAKIVHQGLKESAVGKALFFHARYVSPRWRLKRVAAIGNHVFYR